MVHMSNDGGLLVSTVAFQTADPWATGHMWSDSCGTPNQMTNITYSFSLVLLHSSLHLSSFLNLLSDFLAELFEEVGLQPVTNDYVLRETVNKKEGLCVPRVFLQSKFTKPSQSQNL